MPQGPHLLCCSFLPEDMKPTTAAEGPLVTKVLSKLTYYRHEDCDRHAEPPDTVEEKN
jgi:hypothetical protein